MKYSRYIPIAIVLSGCELFIAPDDTLNPQTGEVTQISYPNLVLKGPDPYIFIAGEDEYIEPGASATLGPEDISDEIVISGQVNSNVPGLYEVEYAVSVINELGNPSTVLDFRNVVVLFEDVSDVDLSGTYQSTGDFFGPETSEQLMKITKVANGHFAATDVMAFPDADQAGTIFYLGQGVSKLATIPASSSIFGLIITGDITISDPELIINLWFPEIQFGIPAPWTKQ